MQRGHIDVSPLKRAGIKQPSKARGVEAIPLTARELEKLADSATEKRDQLIILVMGYAGLRAGEVGGCDCGTWTSCDASSRSGNRPPGLGARSASLC
jgi:integrase